MKYISCRIAFWPNTLDYFLAVQIHFTIQKRSGDPTPSLRDHLVTAPKCTKIGPLVELGAIVLYERTIMLALGLADQFNMGIVV
jgi:hypothetical protein